MVNKGERLREIREGSRWYNLYLNAPILAFFDSIHSSLPILHYQAQQKQFGTPHEPLYTIDVNNFIKLDISFVKSTTESQLTSKLLKYILSFFFFFQ